MPGLASARSWLISSWLSRFTVEAAVRPPEWLQEFFLMSSDSGPVESLTSKPPGSLATVVELKLPEASRPRLMELGLLAGTVIELVRFAPMGDPVEIKVRGYNLTLRKSEAEQIFVRFNA